MEIKKPTFHSFAIRKIDNRLEVKEFQKYENRNKSVIKIITLANKKYNFKSFDWVLVNTDDRPQPHLYENYKCLSFSTGNHLDYSHCCPDFLFDNWAEVQIEDYEKTRLGLSIIGNSEPETNMLGWRGAQTHPNRNLLVSYNDKVNFDIEYIVWNRSNPDKLTSTNYISLYNQVKKWRYMIDAEGNGWSARVKLYFFNKRVLFLQDRPYKEWFYSKLVPWKHYVPVKRDFSDLRENLERIKSDKELEKNIINNAFEFACNNLKREHALERWNELLNT